MKIIIFANVLGLIINVYLVITSIDVIQNLIPYCRGDNMDKYKYHALKSVDKMKETRFYKRKKTTIKMRRIVMKMEKDNLIEDVIMINKANPSKSYSVSELTMKGRNELSDLDHKRTVNILKILGLVIGIPGAVLAVISIWITIL